MKIKNCPFCGGKGYLEESQINYGEFDGAYHVYVKCSICGAQGKEYMTLDPPSDSDWSTGQCEEAVDAWNMRRGEE